MKSSAICPACGSRQTSRNGTHKPTGTQKRFCKDCGQHFRDRYQYQAWKTTTTRKLHRLSYQGHSVRKTAKKLSISTKTAWLKRQTDHPNCLDLAKKLRRQGQDIFTVKTPLRYPGGKSKALDAILPHIPRDIEEYREPFLGGGSVFFAIKALFHDHLHAYWLNDLNPDVYAFWVCVKQQVETFINRIIDLKESYSSGRQLFRFLAHQGPPDILSRAVRFFILNRITFSGTIDSGGYSESAYQQRFTPASIEKLRSAAKILPGVTITQDSYERLLEADGKKVFLYLDPPYLTATKSKLYGEKGNLHTGFDHEKLAWFAQKCPHRWLITYDDAPEIRQLFHFSKIQQWTQQYGMNNYQQDYAAKGQELVITNY